MDNHAPTERNEARALSARVVGARTARGRYEPHRVDVLPSLTTIFEGMVT